MHVSIVTTASADGSSTTSADRMNISIDGKEACIGPSSEFLRPGSVRILQTAAIELQKQNKHYALATMCVGVGQGYAVIIENIK